MRLSRPFSLGLAVVLLAALAVPSVSAQFIPDDPYYDTEGVYGDGQWYLPQINMPRAWEIVDVDSDIIVAVIDLGLDLAHPEILDNLWTNPTVGTPGGEIPGDDLDNDNNGCADDVNGCNFGNFSGPDGSPSVMGGGHGTNVTGIIAAKADGTRGIASPAGGLPGLPGVRILSIGFTPTSSASSRQQVADAIDYAVARNAKIINMSFGFDLNDSAIEDAVEDAAAAGVLMVASRGNFSAAPDDPCNMGEPDCDPPQGSNAPIYPASYPEVIKVGATDYTGAYWSENTSNGGTADVNAPGGENTMLTLSDLGGTGPHNDPADGYTETFGGTSASAPLVSGVAALVWSLNPGLTAVQVREAIEQSADPNGCVDNGNPCDAGRLDAYAALVYTLENFGGTLAKDLTIPAGEMWNLGTVTLEFAPGTQLFVKGTLNSDGTTFTASDPTQGWDGLHFFSGSSSVLANSTVEEVANGSSLFLANATVELRGTLVDGKTGANTSGVRVFGAASNLSVEGESEIEDHDLYGIHVSSGYAIVREESEITRNGLNGVRSSGSNAEIRLKKAIVTNTTGPGVFSDYGGLVDIRDAFSTEVTGNFGGLDADFYALLDAGTCSGGTCTHAVHSVADNTPNGQYFDARAIEVSTVLAEGNYWNESSVSNLILIEDATSVIEVLPLSLTPSLTGGGTSGSTASTSHKGTGGDLDVHGLTTEALRQYDASEREDGTRDPLVLEAADAALLAALSDATTSDEQRRAFGTAIWLLAREPLPTTTTWVETQAALSGDRTPWAMRALLAARNGQGRTGEARSTAAAIATDYAGSEHEIAALVEAVRLAAEAGDVKDARSHLSTLESLAGYENSERWARAVEVARLFMGLPFEPEARSAEAEPPTATKTANASAPALSLPLPNPSRATARLTLTLPHEAHVRAEVVDLLGRRVLSLTDAPHEAGRVALEAEVSSLRAGVYVVRVVVDGTQSTQLSRRLTVLR
ncbi:MAG: S8 family serine peptidase [Bacteroidota bacterium]